MVTEEQILEALTNVYDPDIGIDVVSLGLIYEIKITKEETKVIFTLTFPGCPYADFLYNEIKETIEKIPGINKVNIELTFNPPWTPDKVDPDVRAALNI